MQAQTMAVQAELTIISILLVEHRMLRELMEAMSQWLVAGISPEAIRERTTVLAIALDTHARREEQELFDPLRARSETARHLIEMMEIVHEEARSLFVEIETTSDPASKMWTILEMTEAHFVREEQELFPLAEQLLRPEELARQETTLVVKGT
jgi:Hemerythrin HHE cation binding domain